MAEQAQLEGLAQRVAEMSDGDVSVLEAAIRAPGSAMMTAPGSPNDVLWSDLVRLGWMETNDDFKAGDLIAGKIFTIARDGIAPIQSLLSAAQARRLRNKLRGILDNVCMPFAEQLRKDVIAAGGQSNDVAILSGMTLGAIMTNCIHPNDHDAAAERIVDIAKQTLKQAQKSKPE